MLKFTLDLKTIPPRPGVYFWKDAAGRILYVGKAKNLHNRISEYLDGALNSYKTANMLARARALSFIICNNDREALLLEQDQIKQHRPHYNILLLDDKKYPFIVVSLKAHALEIKTRFIYKESKNSFYYGPLPTGYGCKIIRDFLIRECLFANGLPITTRDPHFWRQQYNHAKAILASSNRTFLQKLKQQMLTAAAQEQYEIAQEIRDTLVYLQKSTLTKQAVSFNLTTNFDVIAFVTQEDHLLVVVHHFIRGTLSLQEEFVIEIKLGVIETQVEFINQFYQIRNKVPQIITNGMLAAWQIFFPVVIHHPQRGRYLQALDNALTNARLEATTKLMHHQRRQNKFHKAKIWLELITGVEINDFLMIDNSNFANTNVVSAMVYYQNFQPAYSHYRKYFLTSLPSNCRADVMYLTQGLKRYLNLPTNLRPDLIIVDGGRAQVRAAQNELLRQQLNCPVVGLVKNEHHNTQALVDQSGHKHEFVDDEIRLFFAKVQIEVDRFAKHYHRHKSLQQSLEGILNTIPGVGPKTEGKLLAHFKTYANIFNATEAELAQVVSEKLALKIREKLKNNV